MYPVRGITDAGMSAATAPQDWNQLHQETPFWPKYLPNALSLFQSPSGVRPSR